MKQRDIQTIINNRGFERGVIHILTEQQEQITTVAQGISEISILMDKMVDIVMTSQAVVEGVTAVVDKVKKSLDDEDDLNSATQLIGQN